MFCKHQHMQTLRGMINSQQLVTEHWVRKFHYGKVVLIDRKWGFTGSAVTIAQPSKCTQILARHIDLSHSMRLNSCEMGVVSTIKDRGDYWLFPVSQLSLTITTTLNNCQRDTNILIALIQTWTSLFQWHCTFSGRLFHYINEEGFADNVIANKFTLSLSQQ